MAKITKSTFGLRIRRTTDLIGEQGRDAFWLTGIDLDAKLTSIVIALHHKSGQSSSELATKTGLSRQLVEVRLRSLEKDGYITSTKEAADARKRIYSLSAKRRDEFRCILEMMADFEKVYDEIWREIGVDLGDAVLKLERALRAKPLLTRLCDEFPQYKVKIKVEGDE